MKTILITGSTDGIGKLTALKLAKDQHEVILHGRNQEKLNTTIAELKEKTNNDRIKGYVADLSSFGSIQKMTDQLKEALSKIDILINNAGVFKSQNQQNEDQLDLRFVVNYLAPFLLTNQLHDLIKKSNSPRVINLSSAAQSPVSLNVLMGKEIVPAQQTYAQSKLALTMWSFYLAKQWDFANVIAVNPGSLLNTKMVQEAYGQHWSSADKGASILYDLASSNQYANSSGKYFDNDKGKFSQAHTDAYDDNKIHQLIAATKSILSV